MDKGLLMRQGCPVATAGHQSTRPNPDASGSRWFFWPLHVPSCGSVPRAVLGQQHNGQMWPTSNGCRWLDANPSLPRNGSWGHLYVGTARHVFALTSCSLNPSSQILPIFRSFSNSYIDLKVVTEEWLRWAITQAWPGCSGCVASSMNGLYSSSESLTSEKGRTCGSPCPVFWVHQPTRT